MNNEPAFSLAASDGAAPVLVGVSAKGQLAGTLFELTLRQTYRNTGTAPLEVVYTFPLPAEAVLLSFACELAGERKVGVVCTKAEAERRYEDALSEGDMPAMLEAHADGLHTANIGNLAAGEEVVLEVRFAQLLGFEQGRLRLAIPTTIAPRYGSTERGGLQPQQVPEASLLVDYALDLAVTVAGPFSRTRIDCPTHRFTRRNVDDGVCLTLEPGARLDRDVVIVVEPAETLPSLLVHGNDDRSHDAPVVALAAFSPKSAGRREAIALEILVDCSGSMGGDSIASARAALQSLLAELGPGDSVGLSRFGSSVERVAPLEPATPKHIERLRLRVAALEADLGGTEMERALQAVFDVGSPRPVPETDILLITDGEIWEADGTIEAARASGHRIFAIGIGSAPAEGVLRRLACETGGACEFATPGEPLQAAARRTIRRVRQHPWRDVAVDWGGKFVWETRAPGNVFDGDTVLGVAGFAAGQAPKRVRLMGRGPDGAQVEIARTEAEAHCPGDTLARLGAARRMGLVKEAEALQLGMDYQLMSARTNCVLVHERAAAGKVADEAKLHRVSAMLAAGWGATSAVYRQSVSHDVMFSERGMGDFDERLTADVPCGANDDPHPATLASMARCVADHLAHGGQVRGIESSCAHLPLPALAERALDDAVALGATRSAAWLLLAHWVNGRRDGLGDAVVAAALQGHVDALDPVLVLECAALFERELGAWAVDAWVASRERRLRGAMARESS